MLQNDCMDISILQLAYYKVIRMYILYMRITYMEKMNRIGYVETGSFGQLVLSPDAKDRALKVDETSKL